MVRREDEGRLNWLILLWTDALCFSILSWSYGEVQKSRSVMSAMILPLPVPFGVSTQCWSARLSSEATSESKRVVYSGCFAHWICLPGSIGQLAILVAWPLLSSSYRVLSQASRVRERERGATETARGEAPQLLPRRPDLVDSLALASHHAISSALDEAKRAASGLLIQSVAETTVPCLEQAPLQPPTGTRSSPTRTSTTTRPPTTLEPQ